MGKAAELREVRLSKLKPYARNAKQHSAEQIEKIADSIRALGFVSPCLIDREYNVIAGHGRIQAAKLAGLEEVPCVFVEGLSEAQRRAYIIADNRLTELGEWNMDAVRQELQELAAADFDISLTGFDIKIDFDWFEREEKDGNQRQEGNDEYNAFLDKFEAKKTTGDCYTPENIYDAVADWVAEEYGVERSKFVRPFYPGGDYQKAKYEAGAVVVDNPPFSIVSEIIKWYNAHGVKFFLFAPGLTVFTAVGEDVEYIPIGVDIIYENEAVVPTSFINNLGANRIYVAAELYSRVKAANDANLKEIRKSLPKYEYPVEVITAGKIQKLAVYGVSLKVPKDECIYKNRLDSQAEAGKDAFGGLFLLSERAAAERAAAERAAEGCENTSWKLSEREREIVRTLGKAGREEPGGGEDRKPEGNGDAGKTPHRKKPGKASKDGEAAGN